MSKNCTTERAARAAYNYPVSTNHIHHESLFSGVVVAVALSRCLKSNYVMTQVTHLSLQIEALLLEVALPD